MVEYRSRSWVRDAFMEEAERVGGGTSREEVAFAVVQEDRNDGSVDGRKESDSIIAKEKTKQIIKVRPPSRVNIAKKN